jgi:hypothetical protein
MPATMTHWVLKLKIEIILSVALAEVAKASTVTCRWSLALIPTNVTNVNENLCFVAQGREALLKGKAQYS